MGTYAEHGDIDAEEVVTIPLIKSEAEYETALARAAKLMDAQAGTPEPEELEYLAMGIEAYEEKHHPIETGRASFRHGLRESACRALAEHRLPTVAVRFLRESDRARTAASTG